MAIQHKKKIGVYHWDTFDNETILINEFETFEEADKFVRSRYNGRIGPNGADRIDIVDKQGNILAEFLIT